MRRYINQQRHEATTAQNKDLLLKSIEEDIEPIEQPEILTWLYRSQHMHIPIVSNLFDMPYILMRELESAIIVQQEIDSVDLANKLLSLNKNAAG